MQPYDKIVTVLKTKEDTTMMKKLSIAALAGGAILFSGCAMQPTHAMIYSSTKTPVTATATQVGSKIGKSDTCTNILGIIATGDCSVTSAVKKGKITKISTVDWEGSNILGIIAEGRTVVTGE